MAGQQMMASPGQQQMMPPQMVIVQTVPAPTCCCCYSVRVGIQIFFVLTLYQGYTIYNLFDLVIFLGTNITGVDSIDTAIAILIVVVVLNALCWLGSMFWLLKWFTTNPETPETRNFPVKAINFLIYQDVVWVVAFSVILLIFAGTNGLWAGLILSWWNVAHIIVMLFWRNSFVQF